MKEVGLPVPGQHDQEVQGHEEGIRPGQAGGIPEQLQDPEGDESMT
jgi:hypothetical protein